MAVEGIIRKTVGGFVPVEGDFDSLPLGKDLRVKITVARSNPQQRWFEKCVTELFKNQIESQDAWPTRTMFRNRIKEALGFCKYHTIHGKQEIEYYSLAFDKLSQEDFNDFLERFVKLVAGRIIPLLSEDAAWAMFRLLDADTNVVGERRAA
jgi:hypothetical protein